MGQPACYTASYDGRSGCRADYGQHSGHVGDRRQTLRGEMRDTWQRTKYTWRVLKAKKSSGRIRFGAEEKQGVYLGDCRTMGISDVIQ